jgi:putative transposase
MSKWNLGKSVTDAGIGTALWQLKYKSDLNGNWLQKVDRFYPSSKTCFHCKHINKDLKLSDRIWDCPSCGITLNRDFNAAQNIEFEGIRILSAGTG